MKLNVDGSFSAADGTGGAGWVLRNENGSIVMSACKFLSSCTSPLEAELVACREGIVMVREWSAFPCLIEMDCAEAVKLIKTPGIDRSQYSGVIQEIKDLFHAVGSFEVEVIRREQNTISHVLANLARTSTLTRVWPNSGPVEVLDACQADCNIP